tara:strand:- start:251 stop:775 length:525 start_codon:yes stop_codon:yes gene_type:complete
MDILVSSKFVPVQGNSTVALNTYKSYLERNVPVGWLARAKHEILNIKVGDPIYTPTLISLLSDLDREYTRRLNATKLPLRKPAQLHPKYRLNVFLNILSGTIGGFAVEVIGPSIFIKDVALFDVLNFLSRTDLASVERQYAIGVSEAKLVFNMPYLNHIKLKAERTGVSLIFVE